MVITGLAVPLPTTTMKMNKKNKRRGRERDSGPHRTGYISGLFLGACSGHTFVHKGFLEMTAATS